ncbi:MAG: Type secretory pathway VirB4 component-like [Ramlibacter sp.]|nr:Type secretory pathway VirB4 component-like [Ramlibacter sp.]
MLAYCDLFSKPRRSASSFAELLPWFGTVTPGLVLCQDGSLLAGFSCQGEDVEGREDFFVDQRIDLLQAALRTLNDRCTLWSVQERRFSADYPASEFSNTVARAIDRAWEQTCGQRRNARLTQRLFLAYNFPSEAEALFEALRAELVASEGRVLPALKGLVRRKLSERHAVARVRGQLAEMVHEFEKLLAAFSGVLQLGTGCTRLEGPDFLGELYARANLASTRGPVTLPGPVGYLNALLATDSVERQQDLLKFTGPAQTRWLGALSMTGTPAEAHSRQLDQLMALDCEYVLVQCYRFLDRLPAEKAIQDAEMFYRAEVKSVATRVAERLFDMDSEKVNTGNAQLAEDAQQALVELTAGDVCYGYYNMTLLALGEDSCAAETAAGLLASSLRASGFTVLRERHGLLSALLTTLPGQANATLRWRLASSANLADLAPIRTISGGEAVHPLFSQLLGYEVPALCRFLTPYGVAFDFNLHEGDLGHTAVVGGSGSGKTTLMALLIAQFSKYNPSRTFIFDKDHSLMVLTLLLDGKHIDMGPSRALRAMNPVAVMMKNGDDARLRQWLEVLVTAAGDGLNAAEGTTVATAIQQLRQSQVSNWRLRGLYGLIAGQDRHLAAKLAAYVDQSDGDAGFGLVGQYAAFFDNESDDFELAPLVGMECAGTLDDAKLSSPFMDYAFYCIERSLDGCTPTLIYVEEAWYMLSNAAFAARMEDWLRTFRKKRATVVFATQSLDELARLPNIASLVANIPTQIFLPSVRSSIQQQADLYRSVFALTDNQLQLLAQALPKRDYLLVRPSVTRLVNAQMPPILVAINEATGQPRRREQLMEYQAAGGADWQLRFLREILNVEA